MKTTRTAIVALACAALLGLTACGGSTNPDEPVGPADTHTERSDDTSSSQTSQETSSSSSSDTSSAPTSSAASPTGDPVLAAITAAEDEAGGTAYEIDDQDEDGTWEIDVAKGDQSVEVEVGEDGTATAGDDDDLDDEDRAGLDAAKIDLAEAIEAALKEADGTFDDAELEEENGTHHWKISVDVNGNDTDVLVDVTTGKATPESDDDDADDN